MTEVTNQAEADIKVFFRNTDAGVIAYAKPEVSVVLSL